MAEEVGGLADALEERSAAEKIVKWIHREYDNEATNAATAVSVLQPDTAPETARAAKDGVRLLTETIAEENLGSVRANAITPSIIDTPANREMLPDADHEGWPTPDEITPMIVFLCSDAASVTSGAAVPVYGEI